MKPLSIPLRKRLLVFWVPFILINSIIALGLIIPRLGRVNSTPKGVKYQRMAQSVASQCSAFKSTKEGDWVDEARGNVLEVLDIYAEGRTVNKPDSPFHGAAFGLNRELSAEEKVGIAQFLKVSGGELVYYYEPGRKYIGF